LKRVSGSTRSLVQLSFAACDHAPMRIRKVLVTAANPRQRTLPLQTVIDSAGEPKSALQVVLEEAAGAGVEEFGVVVCPGDEQPYAEACGGLRSRVRFIAQEAPLGYGHAVLCGRDFVGHEPFLHLVGDHLHVSQSETSCARQLLDVAVAEEAPVSAVQPTRESQLTSFGAVGGRLVGGARPLYHVEAVLEKPTPTVAEQHLIVPGLRAGFYLCFFGMHVLGPEIFALLEEQQRAAPDRPLGLSPALHVLASRRRYLAFNVAGRRFDIGAPYGLLVAQLALSLSGRDRDRVLVQLVELLAVRA
jgi:UTP--glucose-1-phosphate uridylyltransferase